MSSSLPSDVRRAAVATYGTVPNFLAALTEHSGVSGAVYMAADAVLSNGLLTAAEQQAVLLALSAHHNSRYDGVVHARLALDAGLPPPTVERLLAGELPQDDRLRALIEATRQTCDERGWLAPDTVQNLAERGVGRGELYEIFALFGMKTFVGFVNHIEDPEVDPALQDTEEDLDTVPDKPSTMEMRRLVVG